jgi:hypothetical protein
MVGRENWGGGSEGRPLAEEDRDPSLPGTQRVCPELTGLGSLRNRLWTESSQNAFCGSAFWGEETKIFLLIGALLAKTRNCGFVLSLFVVF